MKLVARESKIISGAKAKWLAFSCDGTAFLPFKLEAEVEYDPPEISW